MCYMLHDILHTMTYGLQYAYHTYYMHDVLCTIYLVCSVLDIEYYIQHTMYSATHIYTLYSMLCYVQYGIVSYCVELCCSVLIVILTLKLKLVLLGRSHAEKKHGFFLRNSNAATHSTFSGESRRRREGC